MDKISVYEFFSFVVPGGLVLFLLNWCSINILKTGVIFSLSDLSNSLVSLVFALLIGTLLHTLTYSVLLKSKIYCRIIYKSVQEISLDDYTMRILPFLNQEYEKIKKHKVDDGGNDFVPASYLFDFAYYYLEVNSKNAQAKNFQSLYFLFRNIFTLGLVGICILTVAIVYSFFSRVDTSVFFDAILYLFLFIIISLLTIPVANWLRKKMIITVFGCYYADRSHHFNN